MRIFAICGDSASGKTTVANKFKEYLDDCFILECDRYHKWERGDRNWELVTHLNPMANHLDKMYADIVSLKAGNSIIQRDYDHHTGKFTEPQIIKPRKYIVVCGLHALYMPKSLYYHSIYMDTPDEIKRQWKISRDTKERGHSVESVIANIDKRAEDFKKYIESQKDKADTIIRFEP
jgi:uridine kinase